MSNYHIDDIFRENLKDFEVFPTPSIWENMDLPLPIPFYRKPAFITSMVVSVVLLIASFLFIKTDRNSSSTSFSDTTHTQEVGVPPHLPHPVLIPFSPNYVLSSEENKSVADNTLQTKQGLHTRTSSLVNNDITSKVVALKEESGSVHTHLSSDDKSNSSPYIFTSVLESKPVNTPFYFSTNLLELNTRNVFNTTQSFGLYNLSSSFNNYSIGQSLLSSKTTENTIPRTATEVETLQTMPIASVKEPPIDINTTDKDLFVSTDRDAVMARYNQQIELTQGFHIGGFSSAHNNWILNPALKETVTPNSDLIHQLDFGYTYGLAMGYEFSKKWGLQLEWVINSEQGQRFTKQSLYSSSSRDNDTDINLTYTYFPVLLKYRSQRMFSLTKQPLVINYIAGVQYGTLKSAEINIDNPIVQDDLLQLSSWGFVWGLDYDFYLSKNYFLTFGARTSLSTSSDSKYKPVFPTLNTSNSLLIGLRASFNYQFD